MAPHQSQETHSYDGKRDDMTELTDLFDISGKAAVVTGGSRGIGRMIAQGLAGLGVRVYITARKAAACDQTAEEITAAGGICVSLPGDLSTEQGCLDLAARVAEREDALHLLVNNAGATWGADLADYPDSAFDKVFAVNVRAIFRLTVALLPQLRKAATPADPARVVNIGSVDGLVTSVTPNYAYGPSKAAVHSLTRKLAMELARDSITVNAIAPGPFESKMMAYVTSDPVARRELERSVPLGRIGEPTDAAGMVAFLASRAGSYVTGAVVSLDGGLAARGHALLDGTI
jgi:NAD(P)-dependent dehydrogenase (short-subunit alcohol dehydrogenase family)